MSEVIPGGQVKGVTVIGTVDTNGKAVAASAASPMPVTSSDPPLITALTYFSTADARNGQMQTYTEQRDTDSKTRTITITRDTTSGSITAQSASAWA